MDESEQMVRPYGALGVYLHDYRRESPRFMNPRNGFVDPGDIAALLETDLACWEEVECPEVAPDLDYELRGTMGTIPRCYQVDRNRTFALLSERLRHYFG